MAGFGGTVLLLILFGTHCCTSQLCPDLAFGCMQVYRGMLDAARGIVAAHGVTGLYRGLSITLLEIVPYAALQFGVYDALTAAVVAARRRRAAGRVCLAPPTIHLHRHV